MNKLFVLSGPIRTGKTTSLQQWLRPQKNVRGILSPVKDNKRFLLSIPSGETKLLNADDATPVEKIISVGRHSFDNRVFEWGKEIIAKSLESEPEWLIVDEIGPLELDGKGFEPVITHILSNKSFYPKVNFLFIVRDSLTDEFYNHYRLDKKYVEMLNREELQKLK